MENPLHEIWQNLHEGVTVKYGMTEFLEATKGRVQCVDLYSWAVPTEEVIQAIAEFSPIVEIGAGRGYWASLLKQAGADVRAYDVAPPQLSDNNHWHKNRHPEVPRVFTDVQFGNQAVLGSMAPERTLFLCWPAYNEPMASECLRCFEGDKLIYVGEGPGGCTGDDEFHETLENSWEEILNIDIPTWWGIRDYLSVWERSK
jgi:hypothetical protein